MPATTVIMATLKAFWLQRELQREAFWLLKFHFLSYISVVGYPSLKMFCNLEDMEKEYLKLVFQDFLSWKVEGRV